MFEIIGISFPQIDIRQQTTSLGSLENTKQNKCYTWAYHFFKLQKIKDQEKILKKKKDIHYTEE